MDGDVNASVTYQINDNNFYTDSEILVCKNSPNKMSSYRVNYHVIHRITILHSYFDFCLGIFQDTTFPTIRLDY